MYGFLVLSACFGLLVCRYLLLPVIWYLHDAKGLRKYPQFSVWSGLSDLPFMFEAHKGFRSKRLAEMHKQHPVIRIGPNSLSYGTHKAIRDIYGHGSKCVKDKMYAVLAGTHYHLADVIDNDEHKRKRRMLASAYAIKNLETWEYKVADMTARTMKALEPLCTAPLQPSETKPRPEDLTVDFHKWANLFAISAIANIGLSEDLGLLEQGDDIVTAESFDGTTRKVHFKECLSATAWVQSNLIWAYDWYNVSVWFSKLLSRTYRRRWRLSAGWEEIILHRATTRWSRHQENKGAEADDFFSAIMNDRSGQSHDLEWGEIMAEINVMMNAGSDTTGIALTNVLYFLLRNPDCLEKLRREIDQVFDENELVTAYDTIKDLPYLRACLDESLRIMPPNTFGLPRRTPVEGAQILNDHVAGETSVSISAYVAHRDEEIFFDAEKFIPERWLGESGKTLQPYFVAFSAGARGCIGRNITYLEQMVFLTSLLYHFDFALPSEQWQPSRRENFTCSPGPMPLKIWKRQR